MVNIEIQLYQEFQRLISPSSIMVIFGILVSFTMAWFTDESCWGLVGMIVKEIKEIK